jgi:hypothetical protein
MSKRKSLAKLAPRRHDHLELLLGAALAAGLALSAGCQESSGSGTDNGPFTGGVDSGGTCEPALSLTVPLCVVADAALVDAMASDAGVEDGGVEDGGPEDAGGAADLGPDAAGTADALPSSPPQCAPDLRADGEAVSALAFDVCDAYCPDASHPSEQRCEATAAGVVCAWDAWCGV